MPAIFLVNFAVTFPLLPLSFTFLFIIDQIRMSFSIAATNARGKSLLELWVTTFLPSDSQLLSLFDLLQNHMNTSHTIRAHMHKKFEINRTKIKGGCQSGRQVVTHNSKSDLPLVVVIVYSETELVGTNASS